MGTVLLVTGWMRILSEKDGTLRAAPIANLALNTDISHVQMMHLELFEPHPVVYSMRNCARRPRCLDTTTC
jgi:hypothetical protein